MNTDRVTSILCLILSSLFIYGAIDFPYLGSIFPIVIASSLAFMSLILLIKSFIKPEISNWLQNIKLKNTFAVASGTIVYIVIIPIIGIIISSTIYIILFSLLAAQRKDYKLFILSFIVAVGISGSFSYIFIKQFYVPLPTVLFF